MHIKWAEIVRYERFVDGEVCKALGRGPARFDRLVASLPGIDPWTALASLRRLVASGTIPPARPHDLLVGGEGSTDPGGDLSEYLGLPIPHPLDFDWRFAGPAIDRLLEECDRRSGPDDRIALLGTPT